MNNDEANEILTRMPRLLDKLLDQALLDQEPMPSELCRSGIYVFYENNEPLYVGRSDNIRRRIQMHSRPSSPAGSANFAFILTRDIWNIWDGPCWQGPLPKTGSIIARETRRITNWNETLAKDIQLTQRRLLADGDIHHDFNCQKERIGRMNVRVIQVDDPPKQFTQAMFAVYAARALNTRYNDFSNH